MKLRIEKDSIRIRINQPEVLELNEKGVIKMKTSFPGNALSTEVHVTDAEDIQCTYVNDVVKVYFPKSCLAKWKSDSKISFETTLSLEKGAELSILVEQDFKRLVNRKQVDESNLYPNPKRK